jgi:hypothetical protein
MSSLAHPIGDITGPMAAMGVGASIAMILLLLLCLDLDDPGDVAALPFEFRLCIGLWRFCCPQRMRRPVQFVYVRTLPDCDDDPSKCVPVGPLDTKEVSQDPC